MSEYIHNFSNTSLTTAKWILFWTGNMTQKIFIISQCSFTLWLLKKVEPEPVMIILLLFLIRSYSSFSPTDITFTDAPCPTTAVPGILLKSGSNTMRFDNVCSGTVKIIPSFISLWNYLFTMFGPYSF